MNRYGVMDQQHAITQQRASDEPQRAIEQRHAFTTYYESHVDQASNLPFSHCPEHLSKWGELPTRNVDGDYQFTRGITQFVQTHEHSAHHQACDDQTRILPSFLELMRDVESVSHCTVNVFGDSPKCSGLQAKPSFVHTHTLRRQNTSGELQSRSIDNTKSQSAESIRSDLTQRPSTRPNLCLQLQPRNHEHALRETTRVVTPSQTPPNANGDSSNCSCLHAKTRFVPTYTLNPQVTGGPLQTRSRFDCRDTPGAQSAELMRSDLAQHPTTRPIPCLQLQIIHHQHAEVNEMTRVEQPSQAPPMEEICTRRSKSSGVPTSATISLEAWFLHHTQDRYPSIDAKAELVKQTQWSEL